MEEHADRSSLASLVAALRERHALLVVDNCEHLVANAARTIAAIVRDAPRIRVLATSREPLNISGEATYRVPPHTIPLPNPGLRAADAATYSAVALFVERASAADDSFTLTDGNAPLIAEICRRLDGDRACDRTRRRTRARARRRADRLAARFSVPAALDERPQRAAASANAACDDRLEL